jgi:hypothetical protein
MKTIILFTSLLLAFLLLNGCAEEKAATSYFEIVTDSTNFHEIIIVPSGEVFEKVGWSNLDLENQVKTFLMQKETATNLFNKSKEIAQKGIDCEYGNKEIIIFENNTVTRSCFDSNEFDSFFSEVINETSKLTSSNNFFIHFVTYNKGQAVDMHLHSTGLLISTFYTGNKMTSAEMKTISTEKVNLLKEVAYEQVFTPDSICSPDESNYNYIEIQKNNQYTYYYNCEKNNMYKTNFFKNAEKLLRE